MAKNVSKLENLIASSYGSQDLEFANHSSDIDSAREALIECGRQGIGFQEYLKLHRSFLEGEGCTSDHVNEQLVEVQDLSNYFNND